MVVETILFGKMDIPDDKKSIRDEIERCKERFLFAPTRYLQTRIDYLEYALDQFRRTEEDV